MTALDVNRVVGLLKTLNPTQEKIVRLYFGLGCHRSHSASEIAHEFHVSPQVIGGMLGRAERKLARAGLTRDELREAVCVALKISPLCAARSATLL